MARRTILAIALFLAPFALAQAQSRRIDVPVMAGDADHGNACFGLGQVVGLDPNGDGFLSVQSGPGGRPYREIDRLYNGRQVRMCDERGPWYGVVYGGPEQDCGVNEAWWTRAPYTGPCRFGWVHSRYIKGTAG